ncbi:MAG: nucleoside-diphosphate sugar epimerase/dehydratase [Actinomycetota bacterium]|nr:nucleoside-diphosphate sugar epimerase/dehydratase [Actinomycetota bacterium]
MKRKFSFKILLQILFDILIIFSSFIISFFLRGQIDFRGREVLISQYSTALVSYIIIITIAKLLMFWLFGMYRRIWKYASVKDMLAIVEATAASSFLMVVIFYILGAPVGFLGLKINFSLPYFPRSIFIIDFILTLILIALSRFSERFFNELKFGNVKTRKKRVLIIGAGDAGEMIVREITRQAIGEYIAIGFLDDDPVKIGKQIHGVKVLGSISRMETIISKYSIDEIIMAIPSASGDLRKNIALRAKEKGIRCKTLPSLYEVIDDKVYLYQIRDIEIEDILGREPIRIKIPEVVAEIRDRVILITGAGGSIGSEICRQVVRFNPAKMILVDHAENALFLIEKELKEKYFYLGAIPIVANVKDKEIMKSVIKRYKPAILFHAAAYKHVPLMQLNPEAAIQNNFIGTKTLAKLSIEFGVKRFVMLSTDKAVKPSNVMGISKLLAEKYLQALSKEGQTRFIIVRFGNVLGSQGSVVPIFKQQILSGGPVKVTHPEMKRYFMTIPEAAQLVIQASIIGQGGEVFVLDMGEPFNILDLATNMIKLYGMEPGKDIEIIYTGLRSGEKLNEELISEDEELVLTHLPHIREAKFNGNGKLSKEETVDLLFNIEKEIQVYDYAALFKDLRKIVPNFDEKEMWFNLIKDYDNNYEIQ